MTRRTWAGFPRIQRWGEDIDAPSNQWIPAAFRLASYLTDPVCHCHERFRLIAVVEALNPSAGRGSNLARKCRLLAELCGYALLAILVTAPGIGLRYLGSRLQTTPYLHRKYEGPEKR